MLHHLPAVFILHFCGFFCGMLSAIPITQGWPTFWFRAPSFSRLIQMRRTNIHFFSVLSNVW